MSGSIGNNSWTFSWLTIWDQAWDTDFVAQWNTWIDQSNAEHVFFRPPIVRAWYEAYRPIRRIEPRFLIARQGRDLTVFFPLVHDRGGWKDAWQRAIVPVGATEFDFHDPVFVGNVTPQTIESFWAAFESELHARWAGSFDMAWTGRLKASAAAMADQARPVDHAPWIDLSPYHSADEYLAGGDHKKLRQEIRRFAQRLRQTDSLELHVFTAADIEAAAASARQFATEHRRKWRASSTPEAYYEQLVRHGLPAGLVDISELRHGSWPISWRIGLRDGKCYHNYVTVYRPEMADFAPGKLHLHEILQRIIPEGFTRMDCGRGLEPYKMLWTKNAYPLYAHKWNAPGLRPALARCWQNTLRERVVAAKRLLVHHA